MWKSGILMAKSVCGSTEAWQPLARGQDFRGLLSCSAQLVFQYFPLFSPNALSDASNTEHFSDVDTGSLGPSWDH